MPKYEVKRSATINAPVAKVFERVRDFKTWPKWSPWLIMEPDSRLNYDADGRGYNWSGKVVGEGRSKVADEVKNLSIRYDLSFLKPWKSECKAAFFFDEKAGATEVTWSMEGSLPFFMFWMKPTMTACIGMCYERGLAMLKDYVETGEVVSKLDFPGRSKFKGFQYVGISSSCATADIGPCMEKDLAKLKAWYEERGSEPAGNPFTIYHKWDMVRGQAKYTLAFPIDSKPVNMWADFVIGELPDCEVFSIKHSGPYRHLGNAWGTMMSYAQAKLIKPVKGMPPFEVYENNPQETPEEKIETTVHMPVR